MRCSKIHFLLSTFYQIVVLTGYFSIFMHRSNDDRGDDKAGLVASTGSALGAGPKSTGRVKGVPIILVPSASQTLITIYNVKDFLEDGIYIPSDVKAKALKGSRPDCVTVQKKLSTYLVQ